MKRSIMAALAVLVTFAIVSAQQIINRTLQGGGSEIRLYSDGHYQSVVNNNGSFEVDGFMSMPGIAAPPVSAAGTGYIYFDSSSQSFKISANGSAVTPILTGSAATSLTNGGGTVAVNANGSISETTAANQSITLTAGSGPSTLTMTTGGAINCNPGNNFNVTAGAGGSIVLQGVNSSNITFNSSGAISLAPASGQLITGSVAPASLANAAWIAPYGFTNGSGVITGAVNVVNLCKVYIPFTLTVTSITINVTSGPGASTCHMGVGFYTYAASNASASLLGGGTITFTGAAGIKTITPTTFTLTPGFYWFAWTVDLASSGVWQAEAFTVNNSTLANQAGGPILATGATASAAGVLPATTGAISAAAGAAISAVAVLFGA